MNQKLDTLSFVYVPSGTTVVRDTVVTIPVEERWCVNDADRVRACLFVQEVRGSIPFACAVNVIK